MSSCLDVQAMTPEAALGLLSGSDRAVVFEHLETCEACRDAMHEFSALADELVLLAPEAEPPLGFEQRVVAAIGPVRARRSRWPLAVGAIAATLLAVVGFAVGRSGQSQPSVREVTLRTSSGHVVGDAYIHDSEPSWVFVAAPGWTSSSSEMRLRLTLVDGTSTDVAGQGSWATTLAADAAEVHEVALVDADGTVWCSATLT